MWSTKLLIPLAALLLLSCGTRTEASQEGGDTLHLKYATLLTIVKYDGYTVAEIRNPWKQDKILHTYVLVPRTSPSSSDWRGSSSAAQAHLPSEGVGGGFSVIQVPVRHAAVFTTVHCSLLTTLGCGDNIAAVADLKYIKVPYIQEQVRQGRIADCGNGLSPDVERIMDVKPDAIFLSPFENSGGYGKLEEIGIPLVECAEYMETSPLGRSEWMKFYGMLFGQESRADSLFAVVEEGYHALKEQARQAGAGRSVLLDKMVGSVWYVPGGKSTIGQMISDARGRYPWADDDHSGSIPLPFETVLEQAGDAQVWLYRYSSDHQQTARELATEHHGYRQLQAFAGGQVYGCNVEQSLFYEETPFRPDWLLSDFIHIMHPGMSDSVPLRYYVKLQP